MIKDIQNIWIGTIFLLIVGLISSVALSDSNDSSGAVYYAEFNDADGINIGTPVYMAGIAVGNVQAIALKNGVVNVSLNVDDNVAIPFDSMLQIVTLDFFATKTLSILAGFEETSLKNGQYFQSVQNSVDFIGLLNDYLTKRVADKKKVKQ